MTWTIPHEPHKVFQRNPLVAVIVEIRFFPVLKIEEKIADIQERVRGTFPTFRDVNRQVINLQANGPIEVRNERTFNFSKSDESSTLTLSTSTLAVESRRHAEREQFFREVKVAIDALTHVCGSIVSTRLGLRYVDVVDKDQVEKDLGRNTTWQQLISERFINVPTTLADLEGTQFACEVGSPLPGGGGQTVRYGLVQDSDKKVKFRLDVDRYLDNPGESPQFVDLLGEFADDIFAVFIAAMGPDLKAWMPERIN